VAWTAHILNDDRAAAPTHEVLARRHVRVVDVNVAFGVAPHFQRVLAKHELPHRATPEAKHQ
jgi:hypothetical protein